MLAYMPVHQVEKFWKMVSEGNEAPLCEKSSEGPPEEISQQYEQVKHAITKLQPKPCDKVCADPFGHIQSEIGGDAFVFCNETYLVIAFCGTAEYEDILTDIKVGCEQLEHCDKPACVYKGFQEQYLSMRTEIREKAQFYIEKFDPNEILITGHSLGGSLAKLCAVDMNLNPVMPSKERLKSQYNSAPKISFQQI